LIIVNIFFTLDALLLDNENICLNFLATQGHCRGQSPASAYDLPV